MGAARSKTVSLKSPNQTSPTITGNGTANGAGGFPGLPSPFLNDFSFPPMNPGLVTGLTGFNPLNGLNNMPPPALNPNLNPLAVPPGFNNGLNPLAAAAAAVAAASGMINNLAPAPLNPLPQFSPLHGMNGMNPAMNPMAGLNPLMNASMNHLGLNQSLNGSMPPLSNSPSQLTNFPAPCLSPNQSQAFQSNQINEAAAVAAANQLNNSLNNSLNTSLNSSGYMNSFSTGQLNSLGPNSLPKQITVPQPFPQIQPFPQPFPQPVPMKVHIPVPVEVIHFL